MEKYQKLIKIFAAVTAICVLFTACSQQSTAIQSTTYTAAGTSQSAPLTGKTADNGADADEADETAQTSEQQAENSTEKAAASVSADGKTTAASTEKDSTKKSEKQRTTEKKTTTSAAKKQHTTARQTTAATTAPTAHTERKSEPQQQNAPPTATTAAATQSATTAPPKKAETAQAQDIVCTVEIECAAILDNTDKLAKGHKKYVPDDGVILSAYSVTLASGSSAYDALEKACSENDIRLTAQKTSYGVYVSGINNLDEKDCGKGSGWLYSVNDVKPPKSCGAYKLSNGDKVVFSYTCS